MAEYVGAVDQGTTSTRFMIFDHAGEEVARHQLEHEQVMPQAGWVEHDPVEIWERTSSVIQTALRKAGLSHEDLAAVGITNQRETTVVWNKRTGRPVYNAIVWQDTRTDRIASKARADGHGDLIRQRAGLPPATYFWAARSSGSSRTSTGCARRGTGRVYLRHDRLLADLEPHRWGRRGCARHRRHQRQPHEC